MRLNKREKRQIKNLLIFLAGMATMYLWLAGNGQILALVQ